MSPALSQRTTNSVVLAHGSCEAGGGVAALPVGATGGWRPIRARGRGRSLPSSLWLLAEGPQAALSPLPRVLPAQTLRHCVNNRTPARRVWQCGTG